MGVPVVLPSKIPEKKVTSSGSFLCVTIEDWPGFLRSKSFCISSKSIWIPEGHPSITPPIDGPCDYPKVVSLNSDPKILPDILINIYLYQR
jgi:hypothetical protein